MKTIKQLTVLALLLLILAIYSYSADAPTPTYTGVWYQPQSLFSKWKSRGVTLLIGRGPDGTTADSYYKAAFANGLSFIVDSNDLAYQNYPGCVGILLLPDEPNGAGSLTPGQVLDNKRKLNTSKPIFLNLDLWKVQWISDIDLKSYIDQADMIGCDWYLCNHGEGLNSLNGWVAQIQRIKRYSASKKIIVFIECSNQKLSLQSWTNQPVPPETVPWNTHMRGPTSAEMLVQIHEAQLLGCDIAYFPDIVGVNWLDWDGTTPDCEQVMLQLKSVK